MVCGTNSDWLNFFIFLVKTPLSYNLTTVDFKQVLIRSSYCTSLSQFIFKQAVI